MNLPDYRSPLLPWSLGSIFKLAQAIGVESLLAQIQFVLFFLSLLSLLVPLAFYLWPEGPSKARLAQDRILLCALGVFYFLFPFIGTRAFGEAVALPLVTIGVVLIQKHLERSKDFARALCGFLLLGLATLFRFHVGIVFVTVLIGAILKSTNRSRTLLAVCIASVVSLVGQSMIDLLSGKAPLATLWTYLAENESGGAGYGVSSWYNLILAFLAVGFVPLTLPLLGKFKDGQFLKRNWILWLPTTIYVLAHSLVAHKEERFLYPVMGPWILFLGLSFIESRKTFYFKKVLIPAAMGLNFALLLLFSFSTSLSGEIEPAIQLNRLGARQLFLTKASLLEKSFLKDFLLSNQSELRPVEELSLQTLKPSDASFAEVIFITSDDAEVTTLSLLQGKSAQGLTCANLTKHSGFIDSIIYRLNKKNNKRRRPSWSITCRKI